MVKMQIRYQGEKRCSVRHEPSGTSLETDAPRDNGGLGQSFSPTDLVGVALGTCLLTTLEIVAEKKGLGVDLRGAQVEVLKEMSGAPRKIKALHLQIQMPRGLSIPLRTQLEEIARSCPVGLSLHPDVAQNLSFVYPD